MKRVVCLLMTLCLLLTAVGCDRSTPPEDGTEAATDTPTTPQAPEVPIAPKRQSAEIHDKIFYLMVGQSRKLNYTLNPMEEGMAEGVEWISSSDCVSIKDGEVTAQKEGYAIVSGGGLTTCVVRVIPTELPSMYVNMEVLKPITSKEIYVPCQISLETENTEFCFSDAPAGIRLRGNSTSSRPKKPYRIKFDDKRNLLGMNEGGEYKSWVLLADYYDLSMIRNSTCYSLASMILNEYVTDWRYVNLYVYGSYAGVYLLAEQSQIKEGRIDIEEAGAESGNLLSGYLFEMESSSTDPLVILNGADYTFTDFQGVKRSIRNLRYELKNDGTSAEQEEFAAKYLQNVFLMLYYATYKGVYFEFDENYNVRLSSKTDVEEVISSIIDVDSFARKYVHTELICNWDDHQKSHYNSVDLSEGGTGLFTFCNPWDFDHAYFRFSDHSYQDPEAYFAATRTVWYVMLLNHAFIRERVRDVWNEVTAKTDNFSAAMEMMKTVALTYTDDFDRDTERWDREDIRLLEVAKIYTWMQTRIKWLDEQFNSDAFLIGG